MSEALKPLIAVACERPLTRAEAEAAFAILFEGEATPAQMGGLLMALRTRGETVDEYAAAASVMRARCNRVHAPAGAIDIVGTGGDGKGTLNISTAAALVVAGAGVPVAKHGNRNLSSRSGAADALTEMGVNVMVGPQVVERALAEAGIGFMMAPMHHPAIRHVMSTRAELGTRTIFNILGPLTNPAGATHQVLGVYDPALTEVMAQVLGTLGAAAALVVHGADGLDELSTTGPNQVSYLKAGQVHNLIFDPLEIGLPRAQLEQFIGGPPEENAAITRSILSGKDQGARRDVVLLNSAAALCLDNLDWASGLAQAREAIDSGRALATLDAWITQTNRFT